MLKTLKQEEPAFESLCLPLLYLELKSIFMALNLKTVLEAGSQSLSSEGLPKGTVAESDLGSLESEVKLMAQRILHYRANLPDQIKSKFALILAAQRPVVPDGLEPGTGSSRAATSGGDAVSLAQTSTEGAVLVEREKETAEKIQLLKDKLSRNVSATPLVLKRMKDCISIIDRLDSYNGIIHPAFKKKKTS